MLNPEQSAAAQHASGPALVLAGPGTGKTTTLVGRHAHLLARGVDPREVFVATFTRKAAGELRSRIRDATGVAAIRLPIGTFHSYCYRLTGAKNVIEEPGRFTVMRECLPDWHGELQAALDAIDRFKDLLVSPTEALARARQAPKSEREDMVALAKAYGCYQGRLAQEGLVDFGDLIWQAIDIFKAGVPNGHHFKHLLIDEYQDINPAQDALIAGLLRGGGDLWAVGDDDQAIYGFRGSDSIFITSFAQRYPTATTYRLKRNYRSSAVIVQAAQSLVRHNAKRLQKTLVAETDVKLRPVCVVECRSERDEAAWITTAVRKLISSGVPLRELAILIRTNFQTLEFEAALDRAKIDFVIRGGVSFWELPVVKGILETIWRQSGARGRPPWSGPRYLVPILEGVTPEGRQFPEFITDLAQTASDARPRSLPTEKRIQWDGAALRLADEGRRFFDGKTFLTHCREASTPRRDDEADGNAVVLSTIHQAKGLEWDAVFLAGCEEDLLPHKSADDFEEERRLAYVAASRPREYLTLTWSAQRGGSGRKRSPFVGELLSDVSPSLIDSRGRTEKIERSAAKKRKNKNRRPKTPKPHPTEGKARQIRVRHQQFGEGTVEAIENDKYVVRLDSGGTKKIVSRYLELL